MSGLCLRLLGCLLVCSMIAACGGGGGGGGSKPKPGSSSSSSAAPVDTDGDGRPDVSDAFPNDPKEWLDTDRDGVGDNGDAFPNDPAETKDSDKDGVGDNKDQFPNDASETVDTDKDGVGDNSDAFPNDPSEWLDTDKDGVSDSKDQFPTDPTETVDTDKDGIGDNADTSPLGQAIPGWPTYQGNSQHTGLVDITLATSNFQQRWNKAMAVASSQAGVAGDGYIFFNNGGTLIALDARSGQTLWTRLLASSSQPFYSYSQPAYGDGIVYVQTGGEGNRLLWAFNAADGSVVFQLPVFLQTTQFMTPVVQDGMVYIAGDYYLIYAVDAKTGQIKWTQTINSSDQFSAAVAGDNVYVYGGNYYPELTVADRINGNLKFDIADSSFSGSGWGISAAPVVSGNYVLTQHAGRIVAFNLVSKQVAWQVASNFVGQPAVKGDYFYIVNQGAVEIRQLATGALVSSIRGNVGNSGAIGFIGHVLLTNNLLFVRDETNTYAYQLDTGTLAWRLTGKSGGMLMAEGALVIFSATGVVTIDLEGDIDADGLPDWWEKRLKKNIDPAADVDADGLTSLEEFNLQTNPLVADTDGDGLLDGEESKGKSSPHKVDSDGDGLSDYAEIKTHLTDPSKTDSDGDLLSDAEEIAAGLNPVDASDASVDSDGDGFSNFYEVRANTLVNDANSRPQMGDWSIREGNSKRNSYSPFLLNESRFSERWTASSYQTVHSPATAGDNLILRTSSNELVGWDSATGVETWRIQGATNSIGRVSTNGSNIVHFDALSGGSYGFAVVDSATGATLLTKTLSQFSQFDEPLIGDDKLFQLDGSNQVFKAYSLTTGNLLWTSPASGSYIANGGNLVGDGQLIGVGAHSLHFFSTTDGSLLKTISYYNDGIADAVIGTKSNVIIHNQNGRVTNVSTIDGAAKWTNLECEADQLAVGNGKVYTLSSTKLCVIDEETGLLSWSMPLTAGWYRSNLVLTASHLFYSNGSTTYGVNLATKSVTWSIAKGATQLALAADGTLYLQSDATVTAIDTVGDTDADGLPQWWERRYGDDLQASVDLDADGLTNLQEFAHKTHPLVADTDADGLTDGQEINVTTTNPLLADTDKDGLSDSAEVNLHETNPLLVDSDSDGIDDKREIDLALDPLDEDDATEDSDSDGFSNRDEIYSGTGHTDPASVPEVGDWAMKQGNAAHNGFQPYRLDESDFELRWSKTFSAEILPVATGGNQVFVVQGTYSNAASVRGLNVVDGKQQWKQDLSQTYYPSAPTYSAGQVMIQASNPAALQRFNANSGVAAENINYTGWFYSTTRSPSLFDNNAYIVLGSGNVISTRLDTGAHQWSTAIPTGSGDIAVNDQYLFYTYNAQIRALNRSTGAPALSIKTQSTSLSDLVLGSRNNILTYQNGLASYDIATRKLNWYLPSNDYYEGFSPVVANGQVIYIEEGTLKSVDEVDGTLRWSWRPDNQHLRSNIVATLSHIFVSSGYNTYALSVMTGELLWSYAAGGNLALGADGALYIQSPQGLVAITLEGDSDSDGMPDWWERHYGLDIHDGSDALWDRDADGLTNLQEFTHNTYPDQVDSDGDSFSDAEEVNVYFTDPANIDSDADGMRDDWEIAHYFDPLDAADRDEDEDGDNVPNYYEYLVGTDPHDPGDLPPIFNAGTFSFENTSFLPTGWTLSSDTVNTGIVGTTASHGTNSIRIIGKADISFTGFFEASDLSLDINSACSYANIQVYIDDRLAVRGNTTTQWSTLKTVIPLGPHKVSIRSDNYSCTTYLDNVVIAPAKTNTELGIQFVSLYNDELKFVNADKVTVRSLGVISPNANTTAQAVAAVGNEKVVVAFGGNEAHIGVLDLNTFNWRYFDAEALPGGNYSSYSELVVQGNFAFIMTRDAYTYTPRITRINLVSGEINLFGTHDYTSLALDSDGFIYGYNNAKVYKYDPASLALVSETSTVNAEKILMDNDNRLIMVTYNEILRYNADRLIDLHMPISGYSRTALLNDRNELLIANQYGQVNWYSADWQRSEVLNMQSSSLATFPQVDGDLDGMPDWWELANGLDLADASDATSDNDSDGLTALEEFGVDTDPAVDDTDGDLVNDGDEVNDFNTDPHSADSDSDGLTDAEEVVQYRTNPLAKDTDADSISDFLEVNHFLTDPNDVASKPAALANFVESFENTVTGWVTAADANAGWTIVTDSASNGSKSLRSGAIGDNQNAAVEWAAVFNQSALTFDARVSSESCCDNLRVYVDGVERMTVYTNEQWQAQSLPISAGFHTIKFVYRKDGSIARGSDAAWIDNIRVQ